MSALSKLIAELDALAGKGDLEQFCLALNSHWKEIRAALQSQERERVIEECAKIAEGYASSITSRAIAAAIRAPSPRGGEVIRKVPSVIVELMAGMEDATPRQQRVLRRALTAIRRLRCEVARVKADNNQLRAALGVRVCKDGGYGSET